MAAKNYLSKIDDLLNPAFKDKTKSLQEKQANMTLNIEDCNVSYLIYSFDKKNINSGVLQPYFRQNKQSVLSMCDSVFFDLFL